MEEGSFKLVNPFSVLDRLSQYHVTHLSFSTRPLISVRDYLSLYESPVSVQHLPLSYQIHLPVYYNPSDYRLRHPRNMPTCELRRVEPD